MNGSKSLVSDDNIHLLVIGDLSGTDNDRRVSELAETHGYQYKTTYAREYPDNHSQLLDKTLDVILVYPEKQCASDSLWFKTLKQAMPNTPIFVLYSPSHNKCASKPAKCRADFCLPEGETNNESLANMIETSVLNNRLAKENKRFREQIDYLEKPQDQLEFLSVSDSEKKEIQMAEFLSAFSHDLKSPLHGILSFAGFGIKKIDQLNQEKLLDYLSKIQSCGTRILNLVNDLVDLAKLEANLVKYEFRTTPLSEMILIAINENSEACLQKEIKITLFPTEFDDGIEIDPQKILQVFKNLISNAVKYSEPGQTVELTVEDQGACVQIGIKDRGIGLGGIAAQDFFNKYTHFSKPRQGEDSTGLGLAICQQIIKNHQGSIWVEENPDQGLQIFLNLPKNQPQDNSHPANYKEAPCGVHPSLSR